MDNTKFFPIYNIAFYRISILKYIYNCNKDFFFFININMFLPKQTFLTKIFLFQ